ncbi:hypothetical protein Tsp_06517 [Trichinella spiralis]|uniref:hypothetical protein n=1 Tax=Trichinella spiralis TaxID=6334 RepID=UPI0001EFCAC1|nr:hypothetical protein Tsp_06517 [Trichinella spiralis]
MLFVVRLPVDIIYRYSTDSIQETQRRCVKHLLQIMRSRLIQATILPAIPGCEREKLQNPEQTTDGKLRRLLIGPSHVVKVIGPCKDALLSKRYLDARSGASVVSHVIHEKLQKSMWNLFSRSANCCSFEMVDKVSDMAYQVQDMRNQFAG